ncbi:MAG TPA: RluA family pseudouridine synthase [Bacteroidales bacterium]|nr:RluA family pseudouridine synthase [Bacteroidales bacterium]HPJ04223.1 RluA family pseudouridine synthase [Bacteroidales bacterium]HPQ64973.1 RluA family pseudouridine synthase [Bacteroidales bacterium]
MIKEISYTITEPSTLMPFLLSSLSNKSRDNIKSLLRNRQVLVNGEPVTQFNHELKPGDTVVISAARHTGGLMARNMRLVYEDEHLIVIDKNAGLLSMASDNEKYLTAYNILSTYVKSQKPSNRIFIVHRLDRDTSGLMMFARSEKVQSLMQRDWKRNVTARTYVALVEGKVTEPEGIVKSYIYESKSLIMHSTNDPKKGDLAITRWRLLKSGSEYSLLEVTLETGKKNQIRLHMQETGHSIAGDKKYGASSSPISRLGLHASLLAFIHPVTGKEMRFESKIPAKFRRMV